MKGVRRYRDRLKKDLKDKRFREAFDEEEIYASIAIQIAKIRQKNHLTQKELAELLDTTQQTVSRLEDSRDRRYTLRTLIKLAHALNKRLEVRLV